MKYLLTCCLLHAAILLSSFSAMAPRRVNIVFVGDSITEGSALPDAATQATPLLVAQLLRDRVPGLQLQIANQGYSGHTSCDFLPSAATDFPKLIQAATAFARDQEADLIFSIMLGTNDSAISGTNGAPVSPRDYKRNLKLIVDSLLHRFPQATVVLQYPGWYSPNTHNGATYLKAGLQRLEAYFPELSGLVRAYRTSNPGRVFGGDRSAFRLFKEQHLTLLKPEQGRDGVFYLHPNPQGSGALARIWLSGIIQAMGEN